MANGLGLGIGLQGQPDTYINLALQKQARDDARRAQQQKDMADALQKRGESIALTDTGKLHKSLLYDAQGLVASAYNQMVEDAQTSPNTWLTKSYQIQNQLDADLKMLQAQSENRFEVEKSVADNKNLITPAGQAMVTALDLARNNEEFMMLAGQIKDPYGFISVTPDGFINYTSVEDRDLMEPIRTIASNDNYKQLLNTTITKIPELQGAYNQTQFTGIPYDAEEAKQYAGIYEQAGIPQPQSTLVGMARTNIDDPTFKVNFVIKNQDMFARKYGQDFMNQPNFEENVVKEYADFMRVNLPIEAKSSVIKDRDIININLGDGSGAPSPATIQPNKILVGWRPPNSPQAISSDVTSLGGISYGTRAALSPNTSNTVNMVTGDFVKSAGNTKAEYDQTLVVPVFTRDITIKAGDVAPDGKVYNESITYKAGSIINDDIKEWAINEGALSYDLMAFGSYQDENKTQQDIYRPASDVSGSLFLGLSEKEKPIQFQNWESQMRIMDAENQKIGANMSDNQYQTRKLVLSQAYSQNIISKGEYDTKLSELNNLYKQTSKGTVADREKALTVRQSIDKGVEEQRGKTSTKTQSRFGF